MWVTDSCLFVILLDLDFFQGKKKILKLFIQVMNLNFFKDKVVLKFTLQQVKQQSKVSDNNLSS